MLTNKEMEVKQYYILPINKMTPNAPQLHFEETQNEPHGYVPFYTWIYWDTYYKTVLKELDNNSIFIAISSTIQYKYKNTHRMVCWQATVKIENKEEIQ